MRNSFLLYIDSCDIFDMLNDEQAGKLIRAIIHYQKNKELPELDFALKIAITPFLNQFKRDCEKYSKEVKVSSEKGKLGNLKRWHVDLYKKVIDNQLDIDEAMVIAKHRPPIVSDRPRTPPIPKSHDSDSVSDNDSVINNYQYNNFVLDFQKIVGKQMRGNEKTQKMFSARLKEGFTQEQFCRAITNCKNDKWHIENPQYLTIEFILRNDKLEKYLNIVPEPTKSTGLTLEQAQARMRGELI
jgi:uncharacterized phage protein (TIGR02220 family)